MRNPLFFGKTDFTIGFADPIFRIQCATFVELRPKKIGDFTNKLHNTIKSLSIGMLMVGV